MYLSSPPPPPSLLRLLSPLILLCVCVCVCVGMVQALAIQSRHQLHLLDLHTCSQLSHHLAILKPQLLIHLSFFRNLCLCHCLGVLFVFSVTSQYPATRLVPMCPASVSCAWGPSLDLQWFCIQKNNSQAKDTYWWGLRW